MLFVSYGMEGGRSEQSKASYLGKDPQREGIVGFRVRVYCWWRYCSSADPEASSLGCRNHPRGSKILPGWNRGCSCLKSRRLRFLPSSWPTPVLFFFDHFSFRAIIRSSAGSLFHPTNRIHKLPWLILLCSGWLKETSGQSGRQLYSNGFLPHYFPSIILESE